MNPKLSICIATLNRAAFIGETLSSMLPQIGDDAEIVIVDGASTDGTADVVATVSESNPRVRYIREAINSGADKDYDKAVGYARGEYCWLMTDDDLMAPDAVARVLAELRNEVDLVVVNAEVRNKDLSRVLTRRLLPLTEDQHYENGAAERFFVTAGGYLSFIGGVVVRREWWLERRRPPYYGTLFIHIGVLFQSPPVHRVRVIAQPLLVIRFGNALWTSRSFEIWMFKWPNLIWSFDHFSAPARTAVCSRQPFRSLKRLIWYRAIGAFTRVEYQRFPALRTGLAARIGVSLVAFIPARLANFCCALYYLMRCDEAAHIGLYEVARSTHATSLARRVARLRGVS